MERRRRRGGALSRSIGTAPPRRLHLRRSGPWIGLVGLVSCFFLYVVSGIVAPWWAVPLLLLVWVAHLVLALRWFSTRPYAVLLLPVSAIALWFAAITAGGAWLGWTA